MDVAWAGITTPTATDWIGLYTPGAPDTAFLAWSYVSCTQTPGAARAAGACPFLIPAGLPPGTYELRLLANNVFTRLATSASLHGHRDRPSAEPQPRRRHRGRIRHRDLEWHRRPHVHRLDRPVYPRHRGHRVPRRELCELHPDSGERHGRRRLCPRHPRRPRARCLRTASPR